MKGDVPVPAPPRERVSALVVGLESYDVKGSGTDLPGAARSAKRFASWLITHEVCLPRRITLMTTGGQDSDDSPIPDGWGEINHFDQARADQDFTRWINEYGPKIDDQLFLLFWVGHGFAYPNDATEQLALLGSDADDHQLRHVELRNLLRAASDAEPSVDRVAFVNACRAPVTAGWERRLKAGFRDLSTEKGSDTEPSGRRFVVYAAAHGYTTKMAGDEDITFADRLLGRLDELKGSYNPAGIFGENLESFVKELSRDQAGPHWTTYGYWTPDGEEQLPPPADDHDLNWKEWQELREIAAAIDDAHDVSLTGLVRSSAYYHAVGLNGREGEPPRLESVTDLVTALHSWRPLEDQAPPLVIACDYVANLPQRDGQPELAAWCRRWARARGGDGVSRLKLATDERPARLPNRPYLSISVANFRGTPPAPGQYQLEPLLSAIGRLRKRDIRGPYTASRIPAGIADMINEIVADRKVPNLEELVVEVVLPRRLVRRGWKPEYTKLKAPLGLDYAIVIRDQDVARGGRENGAAVARAKAWTSFQRMANYVPDEDSRWSDRIEWFTCEDAKKATSKEIAVTLNNRDRYCIGLGRKKEAASSDRRGNGPLMGLVESVESGAAIVVTIQHAKGCNGCGGASSGQVKESSEQSEESSGLSDGSKRPCEIPAGKSRVNQRVDQSPNGLHDLPYILRDFRNELGANSELQVCVYMEDPGRLWWESVSKLQSQCHPNGSRNSSGKGN